MNGPRLLKKYLQDTQQRPIDLSRETGLDPGQLSRWLRGERRPGLDNATKLEKHTRGKVPAEAWLAQ